VTVPAGIVELAVPLVIVVSATFAWLLWSRPAKPPRFRGYAVRQGWQVDPLAPLNWDLRQGRIAVGVGAVRDRLVSELSEGREIDPRELRRSPIFSRSDRSSGTERARRQLRALDITYELAARAEDPQRTDLWSRWRKPVWREKARQRFEAELAELDALWSTWEKAG